MILKGLLLIGLLFLPGFVTFPLLRKKPGDFLEGLFTILLLSILIVSIVGVLLAELSAFSLSGIIAFSGLYILFGLVVLRYKRDLTPPAPLPSEGRGKKDPTDATRRTDSSFSRREEGWGVRFLKLMKKPTPERDNGSGSLPSWKPIEANPTWTTDNRQRTLLICILLIAAGLGSFTFEYIPGGRDPGVYINTGINLAHTGSLIIQDRLLEDLDASQQELFYSSSYYKYPGFFVHGSTITPQFLPLFPIWVAIFYLTLGLKGTLWVNTFFGVLGIFSVYLVGRQVFYPFVGLVSALLLTVSATQIWYMRYPSPEVLLQFLIFAGIYTYDQYQREANGRLGIVSALALGLTFLAKPLAFFLLIPVGLYVYWRTFRRWISLDGHFIFPFALCLLHAIFHIYHFNSSYILGHLQRLKANWLLISLLIVLPVLVWLTPKFGRWGHGDAGTRRQSYYLSVAVSLRPRVSFLRPVSVILLIALTFYGYFIRPLLAQEVYHVEMGHRYRDYDMDSLVHLGWYFSPVVLLLGVIGASLFIYRRIDRVNLLFFLIGLTYSFFILKGTQDAWDHIWVMRRYVPVVIPVFLLFAVYALWHLYNFSPSSILKRFSKPLSISILCFVLIYLLVVAWPIIKHREYQGIIHFMDQLSGLFTDKAIVILDTFDIPLRVAPPLEYIYRKNVLVLYRSTLEGYQEFMELVHQWIREGREVYFVTPLSQSLEPVKKLTLKVPEMEYAIGHLPKKINELYGDLYVHRLTEQDGIIRHLLKVGVNDLGLIEGFYHVEYSPEGNTTYRWTKGTARVILPGAVKLRIRMRGLRPDFLPKAVVDVFISDTLVATLQTSSTFQDYEVVIPENFIKDPMILVLKVPTWNPRDILKTPDVRDLGVMIAEIEAIK